MTQRLPIGATTLAEAFIRAETLGERPAWASIAEHEVEARQPLSYGELFGASRRIAAGLRHQGVVQNERLAIVALPSPDYAKGVAGAILAGAAAAPVNHLFKERELAAYLKLLRPAAVLVDASTLPLVRAAVQQMAATPLLIGTDAQLATDTHLDALAQFQPAPAPSVSPDDSALILHTSGTTGLPKGVVRTHGAYCAFMEMWGSGYLADGDRVLAAAPLYHQAGLLLGWIGAVARGLPFFHLCRFKAEDFWEVVRRNKITVPLGMLSPIPARLAQLPPDARDRDHSVRWIAAGAPIEIWRQLQDRHGVAMHTGYGSTETTLMAFSALPDGVEERFDETELPATATYSPAGKPIANYGECRVVRPDGSRTAPNEVGALQFRGKSVFKAYLHDPETTRAAFTEDGWFNPGDSGYVDEKGLLYILGRTTEMIRRSGENISPRELESVLQEHPQIAMAAVLGVPDPLRGAEVRACIVRRAGSTLTAQEVFAYCREQLSVFKVPRYVEFRESLPMTATGKVRKSLLGTLAESPHYFDRYVLERRPTPVAPPGEREHH